MPIDLAISQKPNSLNLSYRPMDLRVAKHSDNINNACDVDDIYEVEEEEDVEGDPTLLNEFSIYECFEEYRNMHTDDEEFPDSDDEYDFQPRRRSGKPKSKITVGHDELGQNGTGLEEKENETNNTTHNNFEKELHEAKVKKVSLRKVNKLLRQKGMAYTRPDGTVVPARSVKKGCDCKMKCAEKYPDTVRKQLLQNILDLNLSGQNQFIANHMIITKTKGDSYNSTLAVNSVPDNQKDLQVDIVELDIDELVKLNQNMAYFHTT
ncbi:uncharacterized protein LOC135702361 [Ochlerotatus camptorhynchus]|uniref:uncharacterized protein LOC135702361 n=1 Tax=Ochlerotatus camptorhynchus TaxID=644619 RepID=UPI0031D1454A